MPGTNPSALPGYQSTYSRRANDLGAADGSVVSSWGGYAVPGAYAGPNLKHNALNGLKSLVFAPGKALQIAAPPVVPAPNASGGAFPTGITVMAVVKPTSLTNLTALGMNGSRRTVVGWQGTWDSRTTSGGLEVTPNGKLIPSMMYDANNSYWGYDAPNGAGTVGVGAWSLVGLISDGATVKTLKGLSLDRTAPNDQAGANRTQFVGGFTLGADSAFPGLQDWTGEIAEFVVFNQALSLTDYRAGATWLLDLYGLPTREIAVNAMTGTSGTLAFVALSSASTGRKADVPRNATIPAGAVTYKVNGGPAITPAQLLYQPVVDAVPGCAMLAFRFASPVGPSDVVTLSIAQGTVPTTEGFVDELLDGPVTNNRGQSAILPQTLPPTTTMRQGFNLSGSGQYWTPEASLKNLLKCSGDNYGSLSVDAKGYRTSPTVGLRYLLRSGSGDATDGTRAVISDWAGAEFGRYVVTWTGADGSNLAIETSATDAGQTVITPVTSLDVLTGATKKRYFDVAPAPGSIRNRPAFDLVYKAAVYVTDVEVKLARYEGTTGLYADQVIARSPNCAGWRFMDFIPTNFSNIAHPNEFAVNDSLGYGSQTRRTIPIARIESYEGPHYSRDNDTHHYLVTTTVPHGIASGQLALIESTNGGAINVTHPSGVVNMVFKGWIGHALSPTTFYFGDYTPGSPHEVTTVPFTGTNAILSVTVSHGAPPEAAAALVNETGAERFHLTAPHALTDAGIDALIDRICAVLASGKKLDLEVSNEVWNFAFSQYTFFRSESIRLGYLPQDANDPYPAYTYHSARMLDRARARWVANGRNAADVRIVFNFQQSNADQARTVAQWLQANRPDITAVDVSVAPYHYWNGLYNVAGFDYSALTLEECMDFQEAWKVAEKPWFYDAQVAEFSSRGITPRLTAYEYQWAYNGLGGEGAGATRDDRWESWNKVNLAAINHPRSYGVYLQFMKELQDRGIRVGYVYGWTGGQVYEHGVVGGGYYGIYLSGLTQLPGKADGTDGKADVRPLFRDGSGRPKWPPRLPDVSARGLAVNDWNAAAAGLPALTATWGEVSTPRSGPVDSLSLTFSESVSGVGLSDITLTRDGSPIPLTGATLAGSGASYTLDGLTSLTSAVGVYVLTLVAAGSGISTTTPALVELSANAVRVWTVEAPPAPAGLDPFATIAAYFNLRIG